MTAIDKLAAFIRKRYETGQLFDNLVDNLKQTEKDRIIKSFNDGLSEGGSLNTYPRYIDGDDYYTQTYENK